MNIVILTIGNTGSTVLVRMLKTLGWCLDKDVQPNCEEGKTAIHLNNTLREGGHVDPHKISQYVGSLKQPWIIKDPRLSVTFEHWKPCLDKGGTLLIWLRRDLSSVENSLRSRGWGHATEYGYVLWRPAYTLSWMDENNQKRFREWKGPKVELHFEKLSDAIVQFQHDKIKLRK